MNYLNLASPTSAAGRKANAKAGNAMSDGSFPIPNVAYLKKAMRAIGRAPASKRPAVKALIRKRAKELGATGMLKSPAWSMANATLPEGIMDLAGSLPVVSSGDGPRTVVMAAAKKTGLQPHQVKTYAKLRKRGMPHAAAKKAAGRVKDTRANQMGSAASVMKASGSASLATLDFAALEGGQTARTARGHGSGGTARGGTTNQASITGPQRRQGTYVGKKGGSGQLGGRGGTGNVTPGIKTVRGSSATPPGGKLLAQSAGKYKWPDNRGGGTVPRTPVSTYPGKLPSNLNVKVASGGPAGDFDINSMSRGAQRAYRSLRGKGISHRSAAHVVSQYFGSGRVRNQLQLNKGGSNTNLRLKNSGSGTGASRGAPKA